MTSRRKAMAPKRTDAAMLAALQRAASGDASDFKGGALHAPPEFDAKEMKHCLSILERLAASRGQPTIVPSAALPLLP